MNIIEKYNIPAIVGVMLFWIGIFIVPGLILDNKYKTKVEISIDQSIKKSNEEVLLDRLDKIDSKLNNIERNYSWFMSLFVGQLAYTNDLINNYEQLIEKYGEMTKPIESIDPGSVTNFVYEFN